MFLVQSIYDRIQLAQFLGHVYGDNGTRTKIYGSLVLGNLTQALQRPPGLRLTSRRRRRLSQSSPLDGRAAFVESCEHHCAFPDSLSGNQGVNAWSGIRIDNVTAAEAHLAWYERQRAAFFGDKGATRERGEGVQLWEQVRDYPCDECCGKRET
ncbi:unnamed protein product [Vitrella brassicaformis CCMP3155]|uniref:Uncharacterized protein n=1 Tax=Vitrella brassicaformis (strain CCMP3155) TaxID=1169540 RepID=A0A0G4FW55_VITBC|nr:unnamed protein product [Vitrella brassicaformis CCMP3155]|eukprot:CEM19425.1 unnamed protein product [Vitrella brassicaformis CCMP3155]